MVDSHPPSDAAPAAINGGSPEALGLSVGSKRQRRPSVRLGDIGEQSAAAVSCESYIRRLKQWKIIYPALPTPAAGKTASSKTRPLTHLANGDSNDPQRVDNKNPSPDFDFSAIGVRKRDLKASGRFFASGTKRVRSNWVPRAEDCGEGAGSGSGGGDGDDREEGFREFDPEGSESPLKGETPDHSMENLGVGLQQMSEKPQLMKEVVRDGDLDAVDLDDPSDTDGRDWKGLERNGVGERRRGSFDSRVRMWLNELGLDRYAGVFELHEVDDEVLPLLTLEDLKDMGISAVGSRRKMYSAIQKLGKKFSLEFG